MQMQFHICNATANWVASFLTTFTPLRFPSPVENHSREKLRSSERLPMRLTKLVRSTTPTAFLAPFETGASVLHGRMWHSSTQRTMT